uniref:Secreted protein n=1 Tax=Anopheles darlingi TaxID=43151 RepID=A0A2M4D8R9_ANODA
MCVCVVCVSVLLTNCFSVAPQIGPDGVLVCGGGSDCGTDFTRFHTRREHDDAGAPRENCTALKMMIKTINQMMMMMMMIMVAAKEWLRIFIWLIWGFFSLLFLFLLRFCCLLIRWFASPPSRGGRFPCRAIDLRSSHW